MGLIRGSRVGSWSSMAGAGLGLLDLLFGLFLGPDPFSSAAVLGFEFYFENGF